MSKLLRSPTLNPYNSSSSPRSSLSSSNPNVAQSSSLKRPACSPLTNDDKKNKDLIQRCDPLSGTLEDQMRFLVQQFLEWQPMWEKLKGIDTIDPIAVGSRFTAIDEELNQVNRKLVATNIIIAGLEEENEESFEGLYQTVRTVFQQLNLPSLDFSQCRRLGRKTTRPRLVQVKLLRERDKYTILERKSQQRNDPFMKKIFINPERTKMDRQKEGILRAARKQLRSDHPGARFEIRQGKMTMINGKSIKTFTVDPDGAVLQA